MKQMIVNVGGLTVEEKQRVNEALAKIKNISKQVNVTPNTGWFYAPSDHGLRVGWNSIHKSERPTHTPQQVLEMAAMAERGHVHAKLMAQYAEDAKTSKTPWELWEYLDKDDGWTTFRGSPGWYETSEYRRKPKTHMVHGVEIPDLRVSPEDHEGYYYPTPHFPVLVQAGTYMQSYARDVHRSEHGLCYRDTEEGKQAAILHAKIMLGIA